MESTKQIEIAVPGQARPVSALWQKPRAAKAVITLAHGAGAGMRHRWLDELANALAERGLACLRYQFPYMEEGKKRVDSPKVSIATVEAAVNAARELAPKLPLYAAGKSFGARMTTQAAALGALGETRGVICFGFPLHPANKPGVERAAHLEKLKLPTLFLQGTRDALADLALLRPILAAHPRYLQLHVVEHADHGFAVLKSSGRTGPQVLAELAEIAAKFCRL